MYIMTPPIYTVAAYYDPLPIYSVAVYYDPPPYTCIQCSCISYPLPVYSVADTTCMYLHAFVHVFNLSCNLNESHPHFN